MRHTLSATFEKWASWKSILSLFALQMLFNLIILPAGSGSDAHGLPILDLQLWYTPQYAYEVIGAYTPELRQAAALTRLTLDIIYPLVYGLLLALLLVVTFRRAFPATDASARRTTTQRRNLINGETALSQERVLRRINRDFIVFIPWFGVLFDYLENVSLATMYLNYPVELILVAWSSTVFSALKWIFIGAGFVLALIGGVKLAFSKR